MRIAIPIKDGQFCPHFGRCDGVFLAEVDPAGRTIDQPRTIKRGASGCDRMPQWLRELAVEQVVAGGIGVGAIEGLKRQGIDVARGYAGDDPLEVLKQYFANPSGGEEDPCDDEPHHHHHCRED